MSVNRFYVVTTRGERRHTLVRAKPSAEKPHDAGKDERTDEVVFEAPFKEFWSGLKAAGYAWVQDGSFGRKYWTQKATQK